MKFSGINKISVNGKCMWPSSDTSAPTGVLKIIKHTGQYPSSDNLSVPPYSNTETVVYETGLDKKNAFNSTCFTYLGAEM